VQSDTGQKGAGEWQRVSRAEPCRICGKPDYCTRSDDGAECCMRVESQVPMKNGGWLHRNGDAPRLVVVKPKERRKTDTELSNRFGPLARSWYVKQSEAMTHLAGLLGVTTASLDRLHIGFDGEAFTCPEVNNHYQVVGVNRRFPNGRRFYVIGSRPALTYAEDWSDGIGPILIVEGASDVAAGLTLGLCVVGRPSNTGGVDYLTRLLSKHGDRRIVLIAERDEKDRATLVRHRPDCRCCGQCFPGKFGAVQMSIRLSKRLDRIVEWSFLVDAAKDLRAWLNGKKADVNNELAMARLRSSLLRRIAKPIKTA